MKSVRNPGYVVYNIYGLRLLLCDLVSFYGKKKKTFSGKFFPVHL